MTNIPVSLQQYKNNEINELAVVLWNGLEPTMPIGQKISLVKYKLRDTFGKEVDEKIPPFIAKQPVVSIPVNPNPKKEDKGIQGNFFNDFWMLP